jgi:hypothetical protein
LLTVPFLFDSQVPDLTVTDSDSDKRRDSFDEGTVEDLGSWSPTLLDLSNAKSAARADMNCGIVFRQTTVAVADLGLDGDEE